VAYPDKGSCGVRSSHIQRSLEARPLRDRCGSGALRRCRGLRYRAGLPLGHRLDSRPSHAGRARPARPSRVRPRAETAAGLGGAGPAPGSASHSAKGSPDHEGTGFRAIPVRPAFDETRADQGVDRPPNDRGRDAYAHLGAADRALDTPAPSGGTSPNSAGASGPSAATAAAAASAAAGHAVTAAPLELPG
jgi:hypothetical protein